jgi:hypothetical protein
MKRTLLALALCAAPMLCMGADEVVGGPIAVNVGARTATIVWLVNEAQRKDWDVSF